MATTAMNPLADNSRPHPRRPVAGSSVSLLHRPNKRVKRDSDSLESGRTTQTTSPGDATSPSSVRPLIGKDSSGESSNVDNWFDTANSGARQNSAGFVDDDPPFFLRNSSSSDNPQHGQQQMSDAMQWSHGLGMSQSHLHMHMDNSSVDDFRSVIDDLTVENKKLKKRLRKYQNMYDPHLDHDRLFEVRVHELPPEKKHELEDMLRKFIAGIGDTSHTAFPTNGYEGLAPMASKHDMTNDSAYASASASGQGSSSRSDGKQSRPLQTVASRQRNIQNYLHDIPEGLMPTRQPSTMTDDRKKRIVVRRLEQLFAGKGAVGGGPQQSAQQQEVSQSAAQADRSELEAAGQLAFQEGEREPFIMEQETEAPGDTGGHALSKDASAANIASPRHGTTQQQDFAASASVPKALEQRPTRPLDLDPYRAQVPQDNIRYMRHLGFSPLDPELLPANEEHGWVYLNFLINMAQLHTINVTADFVRQAVEAHSDRLEISPDGRKLRWKGHSGLTQLSRSSDEMSSGSLSGEADGLSPRKRPKFLHSNSRSAVPTTADTSKLVRHDPSRYTYLSSNYRRSRLESQDDSPSEADDDSALAGMQSTTHGKRPAKNDGPIIFYNNARFCTDLSGTRGASTTQDIPFYATLGTEPLGKSRDIPDPSLETRGPLYDAPNMQHQDDPDEKSPSMSSSMNISFPSPASAGSSAHAVAEPVEMEVTGMGGTWPTDNFSIDVRSRYVAESGKKSVDRGRQLSSLPPRMRKALGHRGESWGKLAVTQNQILSTRRSELPPSRLPPTLGYMGFSSPSADDEAIDDEMTNIDHLSSVHSHSLATAAPRPALAMPFDETDDKDASTDQDEDMDDGETDASLDLLAAARAVDPEAVRQREREYDADMADRLAEEIPAGSSAATAGGGSGFASPADGVDEEERRRARRAARMQQVEALKHAWTPTAGTRRTMSSSECEAEDRSDIGS